MLRKYWKITGILFVIFCLFITGCASARQNGSFASPSAPTAAPAPAAPAMAAPEGAVSGASGGGWAADAASSKIAPVPPPMPTPASSIPEAERKRIITADIQMQTVAFDEATGAVSATVSRYNGYFENSSLYDNGYFTEGVKKRGASYTIRIPADQYEAFKKDVLTVAHAVNVSESDRDVSGEFFDLEARLKTLRIQQDRYHALLEKAEEMEDIVTLEKALADVQYQIEQYTTNLQKLSALVDYATIHINLDEVYKVDSAEDMPANLGGRIINSLIGATKATVNFLEDLLVALVALIPLLVILIPIVLILYFIYRRREKKKAQKAMQKMPEIEKEKQE